MTLREAIKLIDNEYCFRLIWEMEQNNVIKSDRPSLDMVTKHYSHVIEELMSKPSVPPYKYSLMVDEYLDTFDNNKYIRVNLLNHGYVAPDPSLKPWFGDGKSICPHGCYDANSDKHNEVFGFGYDETWSEIIDTPVINKTNHSLEKIVAEILWELTFNGWTEEKCAAANKALKIELEKRLDEVSGK